MSFNAFPENKIFAKISESTVYTQKSICDTSTRPFGDLGGKSPLQHSSRTYFAKIEDKKVIAKN